MIKAQFLSAMSHEIRTPINAILGTLHLIADEKPRLDQVPHLNTLKYSAEKLMDLVAHILDFSELNSNDVKLEQSIFSLENLVKKTSLKYRTLADEKDLLFSLNFDEKGV